MNMNNILVKTSHQKILKFLSSFPNNTFFEKEIAQKAKLSRGATNSALRKLVKEDLVILKKKGRMCFYSINSQNAVIKQWKVLNNIIGISPIIEKLKGLSEKIILFGSAKEGINLNESDIDLFVITDSPKEVRKRIGKNNKIQLITKTLLEFIELKSTEPELDEEINRGIVLWEKTE